MQIYHLSIRNFRGIKNLDWAIYPANTVVLVGPNDSTKSTILDAIEFAFAPFSGMRFFETDFYKLDPTEPIKIEVTIGKLSDELTNKFGLRLRGWGADGCLHDEPTNPDEPVLTVQLTVDGSTMEGQWCIITERDADDPLRLSARDRERFFVTRIGSYVESELTWRRGSSLMRFTGEMDNLSSMMTDARRAALEKLDFDNAEGLKDSTQRLEKQLGGMGVHLTGKLKPGFDPRVISLSNNGLALHDDDIPLNRFGLGTKRIVAMTIQRGITGSGAIVLVDEIEHGIEPFRLRQLTRQMRAPTDKETENSPFIQQTFITTHSQVVIVESKSSEVFVVRSADGHTSVKCVGDSPDMQKLVRSLPEAFLARKILVCEGATEVGLIRGLDQKLGETLENHLPLSYHGCEIADGGGADQSVPRGNKLSALGYQVLVFIDGDKSPIENPNTKIKPIVWQSGYHTERRLFSDLPKSAIVKVLAYVETNSDKGPGMRDAVASQLGVAPKGLPQDYNDWFSFKPETDVREALSRVAAKKEWLKTVSAGQEVGEIIAQYWGDLEGSELRSKLEELLDWAHNDP